MSDRDAHIRRRLAELIESKDGATLASVSIDVLGRNHAYMQQYIERGTPKRLSDDNVVKLARYFGIDVADLDPTIGARPTICADDTELDMDTLRRAIVSIRSALDMQGKHVTPAAEAKMIAKAYKDLLASDKESL